MAQGQQCGVREVGLKHAVEHLLFVAVAVNIRVLVLVAGHNPTAHSSGFRHGTGYITNDAFLVPGSAGQRHRSVCIRGRALTDEVDCGGRAAGTGHQAIGPPNNFHAIKEGCVQLTLHVVINRRHTNAVVLEVVNVETP